MYSQENKQRDSQTSAEPKLNIAQCWEHDSIKSMGMDDNITKFIHCYFVN